MSIDVQKVTSRRDAEHQAADSRNNGLGVQLMDGVGDWLSVLIVRDAIAGLRRIAEFQRGLGAPEDAVASRLAALTREGILARRGRSGDPNAEFAPTEKGNDLAPVLKALSRWGRAHVPAEARRDEEQLSARSYEPYATGPREPE